MTLIAFATALAMPSEHVFAQHGGAEPAELSVSMDVAKGRVDMVKALLAAASSGSSAELTKVTTPGATMVVGDKEVPLNVTSMKSLNDCIKRGPFQVDESQVVFFTECTGGSLSADTTVVVDFVKERIVKISTSRTVFVPPLPPSSGNTP